MECFTTSKKLSGPINILFRSLKKRVLIGGKSKSVFRMSVGIESHHGNVVVSVLERPLEVQTAPKNREWRLGVRIGS